MFEGEILAADFDEWSELGHSSRYIVDEVGVGGLVFIAGIYMDKYHLGT